jgi:putative peptidoglycan lipid II flippase
VLYALWNRRSKNQDSRNVYRHVGRMILLSVFLGAALEGFRRIILLWVDPWTFQGAAFASLALGLLFLILLYLAGKTLRVEEIREVLGEPMRRIRERRSK